jgi:hypothetical protein
MTTWLAVRTPEKRGAGWWYPLAKGSRGSVVEISVQSIRCTCPSFGHRHTQLFGRECKHTAVVCSMLKEVPTA